MSKPAESDRQRLTICDKERLTPHVDSVPTSCPHIALGITFDWYQCYDVDRAYFHQARRSPQRRKGVVHAEKGRLGVALGERRRKHNCY
jgi:hypothetical protein